ncbi:MAG: glycosyltransferase [Ignavibacteriaceae bacterium]
MITFILCLTVLFTLLILFYFAKLFRLFATNTIPFPEKIPLSVIVAAKNEEKNITRLLSSLDKINYQKDKFEVIVIDDNSSDLTYQITKEFTKEKSNYSLITAANKKYPAKRGALQIGIESARFDHIAITDADCQVSPEWLNKVSDEFFSGSDFVFGPAPFFQSDNLINAVSCFENLKSTLLNLFLFSLSLPFSTTARSLAFSKKAFNQIAGFSNTLDTTSGDDDLLLREAIKNNLKISFFCGTDSLVFSDTKTSLSDYINQRRRHTGTSFHYPLKHRIALALWHLTNIILLLTPLLIFLSPFWIIPFLVKITLDTLTVKLFEDKLSYKFPILKIPLLIVTYEFFLILNFFTSLTQKPDWK